MSEVNTKQPSVPFSVKLGTFFGWAAAKTVNASEHVVLHAKIAAQSTAQAYKLTR